jgi:predicted amidohydrolase YtcJ
LTILDPGAPYGPPAGTPHEVLFTDCTIKRLPGTATADWMLVRDGLVAALGDRDDVPPIHHVVHLDGATVLPAFCDAHVHLPTTGLYASGIDLRSVRARSQILEAFRRAAASGGLLFAGNFDDSSGESVTREDLDDAVGEREALLMRTDTHSCVASSALLHRLELDGVEGVDRDDAGAPSGNLREQAAALAWRWFENGVPRETMREAMRAAARHAYAKGVAEVHEMYVVEWRGWDSYDVLCDAVADLALQVVPYVATDDVERVRSLGHRRIGGDWFLDGAFGSYTAWLGAPYEGATPAGTTPTGLRYRGDDEVHALFSAAQKAGLQVGVHAIGDAAIEQAISTWERVAADTGLEAVRSLAHRIEHFECATDDQMARAARLGLRASVQPVFDAYWGGESGMYADRIGRERALGMNRFETMASHGLILGSGSDSTVTPLDPFLQMKALRLHHVEEERAGRTQAIRLVTMGARLQARARGPAGVLEPGLPADLVALDRDPAAIEADDLEHVEVIGTWIGGARVHPAEAAEHD